MTDTGINYAFRRKISIVRPYNKRQADNDEAVVMGTGHMHYNGKPSDILYYDRTTTSDSAAGPESESYLDKMNGENSFPFTQQKEIITSQRGALQKEVRALTDSLRYANLNSKNLGEPDSETIGTSNTSSQYSLDTFSSCSNSNSADRRRQLSSKNQKKKGSFPSFVEKKVQQLIAIKKSLESLPSQASTLETAQTENEKNENDDEEEEMEERTDYDLMHEEDETVLENILGNSTLQNQKMAPIETKGKKVKTSTKKPFSSNIRKKNLSSYHHMMPTISNILRTQETLRRRQAIYLAQIKPCSSTSKSQHLIKNSSKQINCKKTTPLQKTNTLKPPKLAPPKDTYKRLWERAVKARTILPVPTKNGMSDSSEISNACIGYIPLAKSSGEISWISNLRRQDSSIALNSTTMKKSQSFHGRITQHNLSRNSRLTKTSVERARSVPLNGKPQNQHSKPKNGSSKLAPKMAPVAKTDVAHQPYYIGQYAPVPFRYPFLVQKSREAIEHSKITQPPLMAFGLRNSYAVPMIPMNQFAQPQPKTNVQLYPENQTQLTRSQQQSQVHVVHPKINQQPKVVRGKRQHVLESVPGGHIPSATFKHIVQGTANVPNPMSFGVNVRTAHRHDLEMDEENSPLSSTSTFTGSPSSPAGSKVDDQRPREFKRAVSSCTPQVHSTRLKAPSRNSFFATPLTAQVSLAGISSKLNSPISQSPGTSKSPPSIMVSKKVQHVPIRESGFRNSFSNTFGLNNGSTASYSHIRRIGSNRFDHK